MNVFVLCTGRCGSTSFTRACEYITNFSSAHESRCRFLGAKRFEYPKNHIEVDNRLSWLTGRLDEVYGDEAFYDHLKREDSLVAKSYIKRYGMGIMKAYRGYGIIMGLSEATEPMSVSRDYCDTVNANISLFLKNKSKKMQFNLESYEEDFSELWDQDWCGWRLRSCESGVFNSS